jgi:rod shape-determining protein MreD
MKWGPFVILTLIALVLQTTVVRETAIHGIFPDLLFVLAVHYALWGPWPDAAIGAWILGLVFGTQTLDPLGLHAVLYGAAAWTIIRMRQVVFREYAITQFLVTLVFSLAIQLLVLLYRRWTNPERLGWSDIWWPALFTAFYTAALAPYLHWGLSRLSRWTGLRPAQKMGR